jgi:hypothetical protein
VEAHSPPPSPPAPTSSSHAFSFKPEPPFGSMAATAKRVKIEHQEAHGDVIGKQPCFPTAHSPDDGAYDAEAQQQARSFPSHCASSLSLGHMYCPSSTTSSSAWEEEDGGKEEEEEDGAFVGDQEAQGDMGGWGPDALDGEEGMEWDDVQITRCVPARRCALIDLTCDDDWASPAAPSVVCK